MNIYTIKKIASKLNFPALFVLFILPIILSISCIYYYRIYGITKKEIYLSIITFYLLTVTVGVAIHRSWSHSAFKMNKLLEVIFMFLSSATLQGPVLVWVSNHEMHHIHTDTDKDPHSPLKFTNKFVGFLWSHIGWMIFNQQYSITKSVINRLGKNRLLIFQFKYYWVIALLMNTLVPSIIGYFFIGEFYGIYSGLIFIGIGRVIQQQVTFLINSITHFVGSKNYSNNSAGDIWWLFIILLGENWHNFHHTFANDYRNGHKWYHFDIHKWIIYGFSKIGLVSNLVRTPDIRVKAKLKYEYKMLIEDLRLKIDHKISELNNIISKFNNIDVINSIKFYKLKLITLYNDLLYINNTIPSNTNFYSLSLLNKYQNNFLMLEKSILKFLNSNTCSYFSKI